LTKERFGQAFASTAGRYQAAPKVWNANHKEPEEETLKGAAVQTFEDPIQIMILLNQMLFEQLRRELKPAYC